MGAPWHRLASLMWQAAWSSSRKVMSNHTLLAFSYNWKTYNLNMTVSAFGFTSQLHVL